MTLTFTRHSLLRFSAIIFVIITFFAFAPGQSTRRITDGFTPPDILRGGDGIGRVDNFSRTVNLDIPLASLQGRGGQVVSYTGTFDISWTIEETIPETGGPEYAAQYLYFGEDVPRLQGERITFPSYPGTVCPSGAPPSSSILTRFRLHMPDGTQYVFHDTAQNGASFGVDNVCAIPLPTNNRGRVFITSDATAATLIMDVDVIDRYMQQGLGSGYDYSLMDGTVMLRDGTRYRFVDNQLQYVQDRNGNRVTYQYVTPGGPLSSITDSIGRKIEILYNTPSTGVTTIRTKGFDGAIREVKTYGAQMSTALRIDYPTTKSYPQLFPGVTWQTEQFNPYVTTRIELPNGKSYFFYYNTYGEVARVIFPTGGGIDYEYPDGGWIGAINVRRPITRRTVYKTLDASTDPQNPPAANVVSKEFYSASDLSDGTRIVTVETKDGNNTLVAQSKHYFINTREDGCQPHLYYSWSKGKEFKTEHFQVINGSLGPVLTTVEHTFDPPLIPTVECADPPWPNPKIIETKTTLNDVNLVSKQTYAYDEFHNLTDTWEYDFGVGAPGPLIRRTHTDYVTINNGVDYAADTNIHIRNLPLQEQVFDAGGTKRAETFYEYDLYDNSPNHAPLIDRPGISGLDSGFTTGYTTRGNVTRTSRALLNNSGGVTGWVNSHAQYDVAGNAVKVIDANGNPTVFDFSDRFGSPDDEARSNAGAPELGGQSSYAFPTKVTNALGHTAYTQYDYYLGGPVNSEDANGVVSSVAYNDALDRPTQGIQARYKVTTPPCAPPSVCVQAEKRQTTFTYDDAKHVITTTGDRDTLNDNILTAKAYHDGLGRTWRTAAYEGDTWTITDTKFDALGRVSQVSNPYRATDPGFASPPSDLWTTTEYDALGRVIKVTAPDGAHVDTAYSGNQVTVTDQAGKKRSSETDALGRLVKVTEDPDGLSHDTSYLYDVLGNLRKVTQGAQARWFAYDSLSRLIRVKNPEQDVNGNLPPHTDPVTGGSGWAMAYSYDANGNLSQRIDARGVVANYSYDALNRHTGVDYINGSQPRSIRSVYDGAVNGKGRFFFQWTQEGGVNSTRDSIESYDVLGRPRVRWQNFWRGSDWGTPYIIQQSYNLADNVKTLTYPSGRTVNYDYDQAGRLNSFTGNLGDGVNRNYATGMQYDAAGLMKREQFGTAIPLYHRRHYNNLGQLFDIRLGTDPNPAYDSDDLNAWQNAAGSWNRGALRLYYSTLNGCHVYGNGGTNNNGNLLRMDHYIPLDDATSNFVASIDRYDYDPLNRVKSATELTYTQGPSGEDIYQGVFRQAFLYDRWGNRTIDQANTTGGVNSKAFTVDTVKNNNRLLPPGGSGTMEYDEAGNLVRDTYTSGVTQDFVYDGENRLVDVKNGGVPVSWYVYDAEGRRVVRTVGSQGTWQVYGMGGKLLAEYAVGAAPTAAQKEYGYRNRQLLVVWDGSEAGNRQLQWLVQDHLGSTRMAVDRSGSLGGIRRHDFAPFGEELSAGLGIRSASNGYSGDLVRQKFTGHERDNESGLDYMQARYFSSLQGRFTSVDPLMASATTGDPQSWNRFTYALNNPLRYTDPDGLQGIDAWSLLKEEERTIISSKLVRKEVTDKRGRKRQETNKAAFNRIIGSGTDEEIKNKVTLVKNFIDTAGGHTNSAIWQEIVTFEGAWFGSDPDKSRNDPKFHEGGGVTFTVKADGHAKFLDVLGKNNYVINPWYDSLNKAHPNDSARERTNTSYDTGAHMSNDDSTNLDRFLLHWDKRSTEFKKGDSKYWTTWGEQQDAGKSHFVPFSATEAREGLRKRGVVPAKEP